LIVEDEPEANKLLGMLVRFRGYQTRSAFTGREALQQVEREHPDVVLLDLMMPELNGYEVCKILKSSKATALIPLVIVTARIAAENRIESFCLGADDFVAKPYTPDQVFQALERAARWRALASAPEVLGSLRFDHGDDGEILRRLGQFRSLVYARTQLDLDEVLQAGRLIREIWCVADEWCRRHPEDPPAALAYRLTPDELVLEFHDAAGWLAAVPRMIEDPANPLQVGFLNAYHIDEPNRRLTFTKHLQHA
jgi:CheY-like chemotaxis protein